LQNPILIIAVPLVLVMALRFFTTTTALERRTVILAWLIPGAGHFLVGQRKRGIILGALVIVTFLFGMFLSDFRNISPFDRHPIWAVAHLFGGLVSMLAAFFTRHLYIEEMNPFYDVGCLYSGVAALLNIIVAVDAYDFAHERSEAPAGETAE